MGDNATQQHDGDTLSQQKRKAVAASRPGAMPAFLRGWLGGTSREAIGLSRGSSSPAPTAATAACC